LREKLGSLQVQGGVWRQDSGQGHKFGLSFIARVVLQEKFNWFETRFAPAEVGIVSPDTVNGVVVVADDIVDGTAVRGYTAEREIDGAVLRGTLPKREQV
jgi:hypothetical protein